MSQAKYVEEILESFYMQDCKPRSTPCEQKLNYTDDTALMSDVSRYREAVGSFIYWTRPNLFFIASKLSQYFTEPTEQHFCTVKHVLRYLRGTKDKGLFYRKCDENLGIQAYSDENWAGDVTDRSTTGYCASLTKGGP